MSGMVSGKVVVVTGAGGGIGRSIALAMAQAGAKVVVNAIGVSLTGEGGAEGPAQAGVKEIVSAGGQAVANTDSVAAYDSASRVVQTANDAFGRIDDVINNAGDRRAPERLVLHEPRRSPLFPRAGIGRLRAHDVHLRPDRQLRPG
ncbi:hypothetical protein G6F24_017256 [Rhizopus arrhizus]|nr:hypothetical protein G6F24_017256 [Rhizopus arrhizus]